MSKKAPKLRLLVATGIYPPEMGGPATYAVQLENELPKHDIEVKVAPFRVVRVFPRFIRHILYMFVLMYKAKNMDVIYALDPVSVGLPSTFAASLMRKKFYIRIPGDYAWEQGTARYGVNESLDTFSKVKSGYPNFVVFLKRVQTFVTKRAERVIVPSSYLKTVVSNWGVPKQNIEVIHSAFQKPKSGAKKDVLRKLMNLDETVIISVGRLVPWKGFSTLIDVMASIVKKEKKIKLLIVGEGPEEKTLEKKISKNNLDNHVALVGRLDKETLNNYIRASDLFVLNTFYEGLSHQILECMAIGTPVITTDVGGNIEIINHNKTGVLVSHDDEEALEKSIMHVLQDKEFAMKIASNAKIKSNEFSLDRMIAHLVKILLV